MPSPGFISSEQLSRLIGTPRCPVIVDVRVDEHVSADRRFIPTARRFPAAKAGDWAPSIASRHPGRPVVVCCQGGAKLAQGAAAWLRHHGVDADVLEGGFEGWAAAGLPLVPEERIPSRDAEGRTVWVTRARPKIDRIACPWLIRRFVDPSAVFLFVAPSEVIDVADRFGATPFDVEDVFWSHEGDRCTFDTMISAFGLATEPLKHLASIIRGADTGKLDLTPESAGLLAASLGLSRMHADDIEQMEAGFVLYDAFYRWCRDATEETHGWSTSKSHP